MFSEYFRGLLATAFTITLLHLHYLSKLEITVTNVGHHRNLMGASDDKFTRKDNFTIALTIFGLYFNWQCASLTSGRINLAMTYFAVTVRWVQWTSVLRSYNFTGCSDTVYYTKFGPRGAEFQ